MSEQPQDILAGNAASGEGLSGPVVSGRLLRLLMLSFITGFSGAMMPGPLLVVTFQQTALKGFTAVLGLMAGHALLELLVVFLLIFGLQAILQRARVRASVGLIGGAALVWMGMDMAMSASGVTLNMETAAEIAYSWPKLVLMGAAVSIANPYFTGWWATIGAGQLAHMAPRTSKEYLAFYVGHQASDLTWYLFVAIVFSTSRGLFAQYESLYQGLILVCAVIIGLLGLWFLGTGLRIIIRNRA